MTHDLHPRVRVAVQVVGNGVKIVLDRPLDRGAVGGEKDTVRHHDAQLVALVHHTDAAVVQFRLKLGRLPVKVTADETARRRANDTADDGPVKLVLAALPGQNAKPGADGRARQGAFLGPLVRVGRILIDRGTGCQGNRRNRAGDEKGFDAHV